MSYWPRRPNPPYFSPNGRNWSRSIKDPMSDFCKLIRMVNVMGYIPSRSFFWDVTRGPDPDRDGSSWGSSFWTGVINSGLLVYDRSNRQYVKGPEWKYWVSKVVYHNPELKFLTDHHEVTV